MSLAVFGQRADEKAATQDGDTTLHYLVRSKRFSDHNESYCKVLESLLEYDSPAPCGHRVGNRMTRLTTCTATEEWM